MKFLTPFPIRNLLRATYAGMFLFFPWAAHSQNCDAILAGGVFETSSFTDNTSISDAMHHAVCSNRTRDSESTSTFGINLPLPDLAAAIGLNSSSQINRTSIDNYCQNGSRVENYQAAVNVLSSVASASVVQAWTTCIVRAGGLTCDTSSLGSGQFSVTLSWRRQNAGPGTEAVEIHGLPQLANANCPAAVIRAGAIVPDTTSLTEVCSFINPSATATVALNTSQGAVQCSAEPAELRTSPADAAAACGSGDSEACLEVIRLSRSAHEVCDRSGQANFSLYIQCNNSKIGISNLMDRVSAVDRACWNGGARCSQARSALAAEAEEQGRLVEAILTGGSFLGRAPSFD